MKMNMLSATLLLIWVLLAACGEIDVPVGPTTDNPRVESGPTSNGEIADGIVTPSLPEAVEKQYYADDEIYQFAQYPPDLTAFARLADYHISVDGAPPVQASARLIQYIDGLPYVCVREFAEILGYELMGYREGNIYVPQPHPDFFQYLSFDSEVVSNYNRQDAQAEYVTIIATDDNSDLFGYLIKADSHDLHIMYPETWYSRLEYAPQLLDEDMYIYCEYVSRFFGRSFMVDETEGNIVSHSRAYMLPIYEEKLKQWGYELPLYSSYEEMMYDRYIGSKDTLCYLLNGEGEQISQSGYDNIYFSKNTDMFNVRIIDRNASYAVDVIKCGIIDMNGREILPIQYYNIEQYYDLPYLLVTAAVNREERYGLYTFDGKCIYPPEFQWLGTTVNPLAVYADGEEVFFWENYFELDLYPIFDEDRLGAMKDGYWGMVDLLGNTILPFEYDRLDYQDGVLYVEKDNLHGTVDKDGDFISPLN